MLPLPSGLTQLSPTPCSSRTWGFSRPSWLYHIPPLHRIPPPRLGVWGLSLLASRMLNTGPGRVPRGMPWECVPALPRLALDEGWREEVREILGLTKGLGFA